MTTRTFVAEALALLYPALLTLIGLGVAWLMRTVNARVKNRTASEALQLVTATVAAGVASAYQTVVADLKDDRKPGSWSATAAASIKRQVIDSAKRLAPEALARLAAAGLDPAGIDTLLGQLVEQEVVRLRALGPATLAVATLRETLPPVLADTLKTAPAPAAPPPLPSATAGAAFGASAGMIPQPPLDESQGPVLR